MAGMRTKLSIFLVMIVFAFSVSLVEANVITNRSEEIWNMSNSIIYSLFNKTKSGLSGLGLTGLFVSSSKSANSSEPSISATHQKEVNEESSKQTLIDNFVMQTAMHNWNTVVNKSLDFVILSVDTISDDSTISKIITIAKRIGWSLVVTCIVTPVAPLAFLLILYFLGFTCSGVMALSCAALCQARIGMVAAGSCFSLMQSVAAGGSPMLLLVMGLLFGIPSGITAGIYDWPCKLIIQANSTNLDWLLWSCSQDS